jgi:hypothetical protein
MTELNISYNEIFNDKHINNLTSYTSRIYNYLFCDKTKLNSKIKYEYFIPELDIIFPENCNTSYFWKEMRKDNLEKIKLLFKDFKFIKILESPYRLDINKIFCIYKNTFGYINNIPEFIEYKNGLEIFKNKETIIDNIFYCHDGNTYSYDEVIRNINSSPRDYYNASFIIDKLILDPNEYFTEIKKLF